MDFSEQLDQIDSPKTRLAMQEVTSSYQNGITDQLQTHCTRPSF